MKYRFLNMINKHSVNFRHCHTWCMIPTLWAASIAYIFVPASFMIVNIICKRIVCWGQSYQCYYSFSRFLVFQIWPARAKVTLCFLLFHAKKSLRPFFLFKTVIRLHTPNVKIFFVYFSNWRTRWMKVVFVLPHHLKATHTEAYRGFFDCLWMSGYN